MTPSITPLHDTFTIERTYDASAAEVWRCWTDPELRERWFHAPDGWKLLERRQEFRVGGTELLHGAMPNGTETKFVSTYHVIVPEQHIVTAYDMHVGGTLLSVSLATMDLAPAGKGTRLRYTEQGVYFDGDPKSAASRKAGTTWHIGNLGELIASRAAT
ncbi:MAG TPA: SRPBCC family protein [Kofleriaceae bacterium]|nr:SRPBCC family protein [Kofleriaceae bacterium]